VRRSSVFENLSKPSSTLSRLPLFACLPGVFPDIRPSMKPSVFLAQVLLAATALAAPRGQGALTRRSAASKSGARGSLPAREVGDGDGVSGLQSIPNSNYMGSKNWAGAYLVLPSGGPNFTYIQGQFAVPSVTSIPAGSPPGTYYAAIWIGIDGLGVDTVGGPNTIPVQAGVQIITELSANGTTSTSYNTFTAWYNIDDAQGFFPVKGGDVLFYSITPNGFDFANIAEINLSSGLSVPNFEDDTLQGGIDFDGLSVEWIVEDPPGGFEASLVPFLDFGSVTFTNCTAKLSTGETVNLAGSTLLSMIEVGADGSTITETLTSETLLTATSLQISYTGPK
jgi:Peptidase A4 family